MTQHSASQERKKVGMLVPPPVLLIAIGALGVATHLLWFGPFILSPLRAAFGFFVMTASVALVVVCGKRFRKAGTPVRPVSPTTAIVCSGPYRFSRNPMYVGMAGLLGGVGVVLGSYCFAVAVPLFVTVVHVGVVLPEERYLESLHGEAYRQYKRSVRRWL